MNISQKTDLLPCPFCGGEPIVKHIGNDLKRKKTIEIKCKSCRATRTDASLRFGWEWLETTAVNGWNMRQQSTS